MEFTKKEDTCSSAGSTVQLATPFPELMHEPRLEASQPPTFRLILLGICVTLGKVALGYSANALAIALDPLADGLHIVDKDLQWTINRYLIAYGCATLISSRAADVYGRKLVYIAGNAIYGAFTLITSFMPDQAGFFAFRGLSSLGAAMIAASNVGRILEKTAPGRSRTSLVAICNAGLALDNAVGLGVAGRLVEATQIDYHPARWNSDPRQGASYRSEKADKQLDWLGGLLFTAGFVLLIYSISYHRLIRTVILLYWFGIGTGVATLAGAQDQLPASSSHEYLDSPHRGRLALVCFVIFACMKSSAGFQSTILYSRYVDLSPSQFALRFLPGSILGVILNLVVGFFVGKVRSHWLLCGGSILTGLANVVYAIRKEGLSYWTYEFFGIMLGYGGPGLASSTGFIYITKVVKPAEVAVASSCLQFWAIFGGVRGPALSTLVYTFVGKLDASLQGDTSDEDTKKSLLHGLRASHWFWAGLCFLGAIIAILLLRDTDALDNREPEGQPAEREMSAEEKVVQGSDARSIYKQFLSSYSGLLYHHYA